MYNFDFLTTESCPAEARNIEPGCAVVFAQDIEQGELVAQSLSCYNERGNYFSRFGFILRTMVVTTEDSRLWSTVVARRVNIGSIEKYNLIVCRVTENYSISWFLDEYFDLNNTDDREIVVINTDDNEIVAVESDFDSDILDFSDYSTEPSHYYDCCCAEPKVFGVSPEYEESDELYYDYNYREAPQHYPKENSSVVKVPSVDPEESDIKDLETEKQLFCDKLAALIADFVSRHHQMPPMDKVQEILRGKILLGNNGLSELVVNKDLQIILPAYNEIEIPLRPLAKALYFLFLRHPEGIRLVEIADYRRELEELYLLIIPNRDEELAAASIALLTDPFNTESLRQQISKIKRIVKAKILNENTAEQYYISGQRGEAYSIPLDRKMVRLPKVIF